MIKKREKEEELVRKGKRDMRKKGQVTLFIIIAIVILGVVILLFYPRIKIYFVPSEPVSFVQECIEEKVNEAISRVSVQGGSIEPGFSLSYQGDKIEYLCYTNQYLKTCVMQRPLLLEHIEREIEDYVKPTAKSCVDGLKDEMEKRGYDVVSRYNGVDIEIVPKNIIITLDADVTLTKDSVQKYDGFEIKKASILYNFIMLTNSILNYEARFGDSETTAYMLYYPNIVVEKFKLGDGSKVYTLRNVETQEEFRFATRSLSWPGGYKLRL